MLERAGLLKGLVFKLRWPVPDPTDPRHPWETQLAHIVERNERWSYGRVTKLRLLSITGRSPTPRTAELHRSRMGKAPRTWRPRVPRAEGHRRRLEHPIRENRRDYVPIRVAGEASWSLPQGWRPKREDADRSGEVFVYVPISRSADEINRIRDYAIEHYLINPIEFL